MTKSKKRILLIIIVLLVAIGIGGTIAAVNYSAHMDQLRSEREEKKQARKEEARKIENNQKKLEKTFGQAIDKLIDENVIPQPDNDSYPYQFVFRYGDFLFNDLEAAERLKAAPDLNHEKFVLSDFMKDSFCFVDSEYEDKVKKWEAEYIDECRYLIDVSVYTSDVDERYYNGCVDRITKTTMLFIVDLDTSEVIHIHTVGSSAPGAVTDNLHTSGDPLYEEAADYICSLYR